MRLIVFDCDGTLADSQAVIVTAMDHAFAAAGLDPPGRARTLSIVGLSLPEAMRALIPEATPDMHVRLAQAYRDATHRLRLISAAEPLYPGADRAVRMLAAQTDTRLGIATGKSRRGLDRLIAHHGWGDLFVTLQTADDNPSKPDPTMLRRAMAEAGVAAADCIMIGDTSYDIEMAVAAGVEAIGVAWGFHPVGDLEAAGARHIVPDFAALLRLTGAG
jgi:phosphoglycolate phosphatase